MKMEDSSRTGGLVPLQPNAKAIDAINDDRVDLYWKSFRLLQQELVLVVEFPRICPLAAQI
jgi:hypothetical protein